MKHTVLKLPFPKGGEHASAAFSFWKAAGVLLSKDVEWSPTQEQLSC